MVQWCNGAMVQWWNGEVVNWVMCAESIASITFTYQQLYTNRIIQRDNLIEQS